MCHASAGCLPLPSQAAFAPLHFQLYRLQRSLLCQVAGAEGESVVLPQWGPDGSLYFVSGPPSRPCALPLVALPSRHHARFAVPLPLRSRTGLPVAAADAVLSCERKDASPFPAVQPWSACASRVLTDPAAPAWPCRCPGRLVEPQGAEAGRPGQTGHTHLRALQS